MELTDPAESYAYELLEKGLMTKELLADIRWAFHFFDKNGDGYISMDELATVLSYLGHEASHEDLQNLMKPADENVFFRRMCYPLENRELGLLVKPQEDPNYQFVVRHFHRFHAHDWSALGYLEYCSILD
ncbi:hypothetical protein CRM22_006467 [Opisthorchis felineus]|uniref:EF-hand domain-containing protein n=1 Tax=Opisthorchis felineus TaxID=147828 RepID=A0A4S2LTJ6_OPIFE|nr:hypothetical protein CRM22_006467 [Opisthorchis felineus]